MYSLADGKFFGCFEEVLFFKNKFLQIASHTVTQQLEIPLLIPKGLDDN